MAHPVKRRRLESLPQLSDDDEIALFEGEDESLNPETRDRIASRNRFKSALEGIFERYGQDFTGIGDEIDLRTGEVVVDNGHLMRIEDEEDTRECLGTSEEEADSEDESGESLRDRTRRSPQSQSRSLAKENNEEWDEQPLASLHLDLTINKQSGTAKHHKMRLMSQAKDPKWRAPDIPGIKYGSRYDYRNEIQAAVHDFGLSGLNKQKSPGRPLRKDAKYSKNYQKTSPRLVRTQNVWHEPLKAQDSNVFISPKAIRERNISYPQIKGSGTDVYHNMRARESAPMTMENRPSQKEAAALLARTGEWSVLEEQDLIKYRLNTSLSYAALASEFPGRTAQMVKRRWQYLKKKMIELPMTRMATVSHEARAHERHGRQRLPGAQGITRSSGKVKKGTAGRSNLEQHDSVSRLPSVTSTGKEQQLCNESLTFSKNYKNDPDLKSSNKPITHATNPKTQFLDHDLTSNALSEVDKQKEELHHHLQAFDYTNDATGNLFPPYEQQQILNDTWNAFPPFDQLQDIHNEESKETIDQSEGKPVTNYYTNWQNPMIEAPADPFWVPYGPISLNGSLLPDEDKSTAAQGILIAQNNDVIDSHQDLQETHNITASETDLVRVEPDRGHSRAASSALDLTMLASETQIQANQIPDSSSSLMEVSSSLHPARTGHMITYHASDMQQHLMGQVVSQFSGSAKDTEARIPLQILSIPDTQDASSPIVMESSSHSVDHPCKTSGSALPDIEVPIGSSLNTIEPLQKPTGDLAKLTVSMSRQSSPLSSLSSSDPRIARPTDLSSSVLVKDTGTSKPRDAILESVQPALDVQPPLVITEVTEKIDCGLLDPSINMDQAVAEPKTPPRQGNASIQLAKTPIMTDELARMNVESPHESPRHSVQSLDHKQKTPKKKTVVLLDIMEKVDDDFKSIYDSLEESIVLLEPIARRIRVNERTTTKVAPFSHRTTTLHQPRHTGVYHNKVVKPDLQIYGREHKTYKSTARQFQESAESLFGANLQFGQSTARRVYRPSSSLQKGYSALGYNDNKNIFNYTAFKDNNVIASRESDRLRRVRATTPIDTYNYMLADPWPTDPLPSDRIPGIWKAPQSKDEYHAKEKTTEAALQRCHQDVYSPAPSGVEDVNLEAIRQSQYPAEMKASGNKELEKKLKQALPTLSRTISKSNTPSLTGKGQIAGQETHATVAVKPPKPSSTIIFPTKNDHRPSSPQSPDRLASDPTAKAPRKQSPTGKAEDILLGFGKGRPLTRANLLSQDEIPSTSQETVLSFLNSQATQPFRPASTPKSSLLAQHSRARSVSSANVCGVNGFRCDRRLCSNCASRIVSQEEIDF